MDLAGGIHPTSEDVISKLKDDGDFDSLRIKIIRKLKENEDLRNRIISEVKQSVTLNREGAENLKPRQLSDDIHQEIGSKIMDQISVELWKIIRSNEDGMQDEIRDTVESVYSRLINPSQKVENHMPAPSDVPSNIRENNASPREASSSDRRLSCDSDPDVPPGFALPGQAHVTNSRRDGSQEMLREQKSIEMFHHHQDICQQIDDDAPPGFSSTAKVHCFGSDEDPDVPPGFG